MRDVVQQPVAAGDQLFQPLGHGVEVPGEVGDLVAPTAHAGAQPCPQPAQGQVVEALAQTVDRPGHIGGQRRAEDQAGDDLEAPRPAQGHEHGRGRMGEDDLRALRGLHDADVGPLRRLHQGLDPAQGLGAPGLQDRGQLALAMMPGAVDDLLGIQDHPRLRQEDEQRREGHDGAEDPGDPEPPQNLPEQPLLHSPALSR